MRLLGWGEVGPLPRPLHKEAGMPFWFAANTWGRGWGDRGCFRIRRGENSCRIEQFVTAAFLQAEGRTRGRREGGRQRRNPGVEGEG